MRGVRIPVRWVARAGVALGLAALTAAGVVSAQTAAPPAAPVAAEPPAAPKAPTPGESAPPGPTGGAAPAAEAELAPPPAARATTPSRPAAPLPRSRYDVAILQALDKVTAETLRFEAKVGVPVRWKGLIFTVRACERTAADEPIADSIAYVTVDAQPRPQPGRLTPPPKQAFKGWMYASAPALNPMQHATYDAWVISCRASAPPPAAPPARPAPKPAAAEPSEADPPPAAPVTPPATTPSPKVEPVAPAKPAA